MKRVISAMFDEYSDASSAVGRLETLGVPAADISIVGGSDAMRGRAGEANPAQETSATGTGASTGAVIGGAGGLLAGLGLMAIPGLGPVVAAGWLASTLVGAVAGAAAGGIIGALTGWGMSEEEAHTYAEGIRRGGTLVTARIEDRLFDRAIDILDADGAVDLDQRVGTWRDEGWTNPAGTTMGDRMAAGNTATSGATSVPVSSQSQSRPRVRVHYGATGEPVSRTDVEVEDARRLEQERNRNHSGS